MIDLKLDVHPSDSTLSEAVSVSLHPSIRDTYHELRKWLDRFSLFLDESILNDLLLFYSLTKRKYLDHRRPEHLSRLILSIYQLQKKLLSSVSLFSSIRHFSLRFIPTKLHFPFSSKPVLGCLIGFNLMDRCELFDEETLRVALQKHFPHIKLVKDSYYNHTSANETLRICYFEVEKKNGKLLSLSERKSLKSLFKEKLPNTIQRLIPSMFIKINQEEIYKNILILAQEIHAPNDHPQVYITLDQYNGKEVSFHVTLVEICSLPNLSFKEKMADCSCVIDRVVPVRHLNGHPIHAHLFRLQFPCDSSIVRSDGSLNFYAARQKVTTALNLVLGEFRDYNGGLIIKQKELLFSFKNNLSKEAAEDTELVETFFHSIVPLEKQALLDPKILSTLFTHFLHHKKQVLKDPLSYRIDRQGNRTYFLIHSADVAMSEILTPQIEKDWPSRKDWAYNILKTQEGIFFNSVIINESETEIAAFIQSLQKPLEEWRERSLNRKTLRMALGSSVFSLDPRVGGENVSTEILRLLFERLTRFNEKEEIENGMAESIEISPDLKKYTFRLRPTFWNDGSPLSARDFVYSWKRILSPDFKTRFATYFYPIKNAKEAKEGKISPDEIGLRVLNDRILEIELEKPTPYFLELLSHPIFSPIHRIIDQKNPEWPYQAGSAYPCNGPFQLKINQPNQTYQLIKNPMYWDSSSLNVDQITITSMDPLQAMQAFHRNEIDWLGHPCGGWYPQMAVTEEERALHFHTTLSWMFLNTGAFPFHHPKIRRALALAINRNAFIEETSLSWTPAYSILFPKETNKPDTVFPQCDLFQAQTLLAEGLQELGVTKGSFSIQLTFPQKGVFDLVAQFIKGQLIQNLGLDCQLNPLPWNIHFQKMSERQFQLGLVNWTNPIHDPIGILNTFKFAKGVNFSGWEDPCFQALIDQSEEEINPLSRENLLFRAEEFLAESVPVIPLFYRNEQAFIQKKFTTKKHNTRFKFIDLLRQFER